MAIFRCKMCGGDIEVNEGNSAATCEFCGTEQTIPTVKDENLQSLFNRANVLRMKSEFDKAEEIYEKILQSNESEAEAYWGLILCKYGIEYVEDPTTFKRIPTCHRTSYDAITADEDYKSAIKYADVVQKSIYESEAKAIDEIQKGILSISQQESPYDVFICYKETDESGKRTVDSTIANDIYYQLTQEGFKVFYAAITLEDKLGTEYEPYIFSALNTAKVMLALGTKPEYFNAVWVKNEWSRFLKIMKKDRSKLLIPCYRDMDAYELPEEFAHLQAQDMSKIGFINDVVRGIKKVIVTETPSSAPTQNVTVVNGSSANIENLIKRGNLSLEDGKWDEAVTYFDRILDENVEEPRAYFGKLLAEFNLTSEDELQRLIAPINNNENYKKAYRFGDDDFKRTLENYANQINYNYANKMYNSNNVSFIAKAVEIFTSIIDFKDSSDLIGKCKEKIYEIALEHMASAKSEQEFLTVKSEFELISGYSDAYFKAAECAEKAGVAAKEAVKEAAYQEALKYFNKTSANDILPAISKFEDIIDYKDSRELIEKCKEKIYNIALNHMEYAKKAEEFKAVKLEFELISGYSDADSKAAECAAKAEEVLYQKTLMQQEEERKDRRERMKILISILILVLLIPVFKAIHSWDMEKSAQRADEALKSGDYSKAANLYRKVDNSEYARYANTLIALDNLGQGSNIGEIYHTISEYNYLNNIDELCDKYPLFNLLHSIQGTWKYSKVLSENKTSMYQIEIVGGHITETTWDLKDNSIEENKKRYTYNIYKGDSDDYLSCYLIDNDDYYFNIMYDTETDTLKHGDPFSKSDYAFLYKMERSN